MTLHQIVPRIVAGLAHNKLMPAIIDLAPLSGTLRLPTIIVLQPSSSSNLHHPPTIIDRVTDGLRTGYGLVADGLRTGYGLVAERDMCGLREGLLA
jgi:hypothetical protein